MPEPVVLSLVVGNILRPTASKLSTVAWRGFCFLYYRHLSVLLCSVLYKLTVP